MSWQNEMNGALITIGLLNDRLEKKAIEVARKIGKVIVDHGDTDCKTPDTLEYIARTKDTGTRRERKRRLNERLEGRDEPET